jgi:hypothetical protein
MVSIQLPRAWIYASHFHWMPMLSDPASQFHTLSARFCLQYFADIRIHHHQHICLWIMLGSLFIDSTHWPCARSFFYWGLLPPVATQRQRLGQRLANECHAASIRLAARIWGIICCQFAPHHPPKQKKKGTLPSFLSRISPSSSSHMLLSYTDWYYLSSSPLLYFSSLHHDLLSARFGLLRTWVIT